MVAYCCVKGCSNNSSNKKKDPNDITSFHAFPSNTDLKKRWLRAIGRPNWEPPSYSRVCSCHFGCEQINHEGRRIRIKDDAVPVKHLPVNSNFEASHIEVCRFCLATDLKMHSLQEGVHRVYMESIMAYNDNYKIEGLPQFICYECAAHLKKCYSLLEKSMIAQATLLDIFAHNGKISKNLVNLQNRKELNLMSPLNKTAINFGLKYKDGYEIVNPVDNKAEDSDSKTQEKFVFVSKIEGADITIESREVKEFDDDEIDNNLHEYKYDSNKKYDTSEYSEYENDVCSNAPEATNLGSRDNGKPQIDDVQKVDDTEKRLKRRSKGIIENNNEGLTPDEVTMQQYFTIVRLSLEDQIEEWNRTISDKVCGDESFKCQTCSKVFAHSNTYSLHTLNHDPSRGESECVVCKLRFKNEVLARSHAKRAHAKKFYCKTCPKTFNNVGVAKKHHRWHTGHTYRCTRCPFTSAHASALGAHARSQHADRACALCGHAFISARGLRLHTAAVHPGTRVEEGGEQYGCEQCGLAFRSEGARRVHILTSKQHRSQGLCDTTPQDQSLKKTCNKCGVEFSSLRELLEHRRAEHRRDKQRKPSRSVHDRYPTQCEHCGLEVNSRAEHWRHARRLPAARALYRPLVAAVCHTCGKGFQNSTKLRVHTLRHAPPAVPCPQCARLFHDKYAVARHAATHAARAHRCACGRAFRARGNLLRHQRVHTGVTPYECSMCSKKFKYSTSLNLHVRTIHYKMPHPPRKKRAKSKSSDCNDY